MTVSSILTILQIALNLRDTYWRPAWSSSCLVLKQKKMILFDIVLDQLRWASSFPVFVAFLVTSSANRKYKNNPNISANLVWPTSYQPSIVNRIWRRNYHERFTSLSSHKHDVWNNRLCYTWINKGHLWKVKKQCNWTNRDRLTSVSIQYCLMSLVSTCIYFLLFYF